VYLLTATRGELGEVIPEGLHHLEGGKAGGFGVASRHFSTDARRAPKHTRPPSPRFSAW